MSIEKFIPKLWASAMLTDFRNQAVWAGLTNREYDREFTSGDQITINTPVPIAIKDYKANSRTTEPDAISTTAIELVIDQEKNFDFYVDDIDRAQAAGDLNVFSQSAAEGLVEDADKHLATMAATNATPVTPGAPATDAKSAWNVIRDLRKALDKAAVPKQGRVFVANAEFSSLFFEHDSKITNADQLGDTQGLREASMGRILGFDGYESENGPTVDKPQVIAFHRSALAFVSQIQKTEAMRAEKKFADRLRGLHVYGSKVVRPKAIVSYTAE
ncbi:P22 phage major capsid protein family protein [Brevibacterium luteolum]|uniref:P22 coat protein-protein 5 domain protein n=1 Tax=Brevibacterium luteolum TaxID=199591 RepID=A0A2N6PII5_9MICO|nr:P22 phage major capsid protein family protein [Brevibacterium luteolum]PMB98498.1 hypothetical protein CJ198_03930 [Brevibacterium luteolum]